MDLKEWQQRLIRHIEHDFPEEMDKEIMKLGYIAEREIKQEVPVDTGRLRASINTQRETETSVLVGTNVDYASSVNNGHMQQKRFLPAKYLNTPSGRKYLGEGNNKGIMLKARFIKGAHFMEKGMQRAEPKIEAEISRWLNDMGRKLGE